MKLTGPGAQRSWLDAGTMTIVLACILAADAALLGVRASLRVRLAHLPETRIWFPAGEAVPSGYLENGAPYGPGLTDASCFALLVTSSDCSYCWAERPAWDSLALRARALHCDALAIAPERNLAVPTGAGPAADREIVFLSAGWVEGQPPDQAPTLLIFARGASTAWCHVGELSAADMRGAAEALAASAADGTKYRRRAHKPPNRPPAQGLRCR